MDRDKEGRPAEYLGDGAYVRWTGWAYVIYTSNGIDELNTIELDNHAMTVLSRFKADVETLERDNGKAT